MTWVSYERPELPQTPDSKGANIGSQLSGDSLGLCALSCTQTFVTGQSEAKVPDTLGGMVSKQTKM